MRRYSRELVAASSVNGCADSHTRRIHNAPDRRGEHQSHSGHEREDSKYSHQQRHSDTLHSHKRRLTLSQATRCWTRAWGWATRASRPPRWWGRRVSSLPSSMTRCRAYTSNTPSAPNTHTYIHLRLGVPRGVGVQPLVAPALRRLAAHTDT